VTRGYFGIGIYNVKFHTNIGTLWRSAFCLGADFIFTIGKRYQRQHSDTVASYRHVPLFHYDDGDDFLNHRPFSCPLIGVELADEAADLETFQQPQQAVYLLGPEDGSIPHEILDKCQHIVKFDSRFCLNVAAAGSIVMYDRAAKAYRVAEEAAP
jgi:tRNA G18 (ribose-2'-O)-methylase SpoU